MGPYELHDFFLYYMLRWGFPPRKIYRLALYALGKTYTPDVILKWLKTFYRRFFSQQFKRDCLPDGPKVGSAALSPAATGGCRAMLPRHCGRQNWRHWSKRKRGASRRTWGAQKIKDFWERRSKGASGAFAVGRIGGERTLRRRGGCRAMLPRHCGRQNWRHWSQCIFNSMWKADQGDGYTAGALVFYAYTDKHGQAA